MILKKSPDNYIDTEGVKTTMWLFSPDPEYCLVGQEENKGVLNYYDSVKECIKARKTERRNKIIKGFKKSILNWGSEKK